MKAYRQFSGGRSAFALFSAGILVATSAGAVFADDTTSPDVAADAVASKIAEVAPGDRAVAGGAISDGVYESSTKGLSSEVSLTSPKTIAVTAAVESEDGPKSISTSIQLPEGFVDGAGRIAADGTVVTRVTTRQKPAWGT